MKKRISIILLFFFVAGFAAIGVLYSRFKNWDELIQISPDIVIARCTSTYGTNPAAKNAYIMDNVIPSDVKVLSVLKGNTKPGPAKLGSFYWPYPDQRFLIFGWYNDGTYTAIEDHRIVPISRDFSLDTLKGKALADQLQIILSNRLNDVDEEINRDKEEKARIEMYLKVK
ncbi:MAG TPA: hypothetical protein VGJ73_16225 [Verrucomicrobiae bacterium]|jgi:hypothetical protein